MAEPSDARKPKQAEPQQAMLEYLDELLQDATEVVEAPAVSAETMPAPVIAEAPVESGPAPVEDPAEEPLPAWAAQEFEALMFEVNGLTLAVPLLELGGIVRAPAVFDLLPRQPDWMLGVLEVDRDLLSVVDTLRWIAPERVPEMERAAPRYLVRLPESRWALACQKLFESVTLRSEDVHWRSRRTRRRWLRGTVRGHMCALLDTAELARQLDQEMPE